MLANQPAWSRKLWLISNIFLLNIARRNRYINRFSFIYFFINDYYVNYYIDWSFPSLIHAKYIFYQKLQVNSIHLKFITDAGVHSNQVQSIVSHRDKLVLIVRFSLIWQICYWFFSINSTKVINGCCVWVCSLCMDVFNYRIDTLHFKPYLNIREL